jgi:hypothetical protein
MQTIIHCETKNQNHPPILELSPRTIDAKSMELRLQQNHEIGFNIMKIKRIHEILKGWSSFKGLQQRQIAMSLPYCNSILVLEFH